MQWQYKPAWEQTKERYLAWWAHEHFGRCTLSVIADAGQAEGWAKMSFPPGVCVKMSNRIILLVDLLEPTAS